MPELKKGKVKEPYKLSIIIPQYSEPDEVVDLLLSSIKTQVGIDFSKIQIVIVNDCSDFELKRRYKNVLYLRTKTNGGTGMARQYGFDKTKSEYVMYVDADDVLYDVTVLSRIMKELEKKPDILFANFFEQLSSLEYYLHYFHNTWCHGKVYRREYIKSIGLKFEKNIRYSEDACFNIQALNKTENVIRIDYPIILWTSNPNSLTRKNTDARRNNSCQFLEGQFIATRNLKGNKIRPELIVNNCIYIYFILQEEYWKGDLEKKKALEKRAKEYREEFFDDYINIQDTQFNSIYNHRFAEYSKDSHWKIKETYDNFYERLGTKKL